MFGTVSPDLIEHDVETLVMQRIVGIALGYEDLIDHDELRHDPVMAVSAFRSSPSASTATIRMRMILATSDGTSRASEG